MSRALAQALLPEFDREMAVTRRVLERLPDDKWDWKPHPRSNTIGWNANHLAEIPGWLEHQLLDSSFDENPVDGTPHRPPALRTRRDVLELFDRNVARGRELLANVTDEAMAEPWTLLDAGRPLFTMPRADVVRTWVFSHIIHHRAILTVSLRLNDIPVPAVYGPSADEA